MSQMHIKAVAEAMVFLVDHNLGKKQVLYTVDDQTMSSECLLGRDFIKRMDIWFGEDGKMMINSKQVCNGSEFLGDLGLIECEFDDDDELNVGEVSFMDKFKLKEVYSTCYSKALKPESPEIDYEVNICLKDHTPFNYQLHRLSYVERNAVKDIICDLLDQGIIKEKKKSKFCSPIVLVKKKDNTYRMCADLRELNKRVVKENCPIPHIDDLLDKLRGKAFFTKLDLKNAYFHVIAAEQSSKYLSFSTFLGQYEYVRLHFG